MNKNDEDFDIEIDNFEFGFDSEEFENKMQEFGKQMKNLGEKIRKNVEASVKHLSVESPDGQRIKIYPRWSKQTHSESDSLKQDVRAQEKERSKARAPMEKIKMLKELLDEGLISESDYDEKRKKILDEF